MSRVRLANYSMSTAWVAEPEKVFDETTKEDTSCENVHHALEHVSGWILTIWGLK